MDQNDIPRFVTVPEAARRIGLGRDQVRTAALRGDLRTVVTRPGGWPRVAVEELVRWARSLPRRQPSESGSHH